MYTNYRFITLIVSVDTFMLLGIIRKSVSEHALYLKVNVNRHISFYFVAIAEYFS